MFIPLTLAYRAPAAKGARKGASLEDIEGNTEKFSPLEVVVGIIFTLHSNHGPVRLKLSAQVSPLTNTLAGERRYEQQDQNPPLAPGFFG